MEAFCDIETQSVADLKEVGSRQYILDPSTRLMMLVLKIGPQTLAWVPHSGIRIPSPPCLVTYGPKIPQWLQSAAEYAEFFVGHNCDNFDAPFLEHHYGLTPKWYDTMPAARASGLPGGLDAIGKALGVEGKDKDGKDVMRLLCKGARNKITDTIEYHVGTAHLWAKLLAYNIQDVALTERVYQEVAGREEEDVVRVDKAINRRGIQVDGEWLTDLLRLWDDLVRHGGDRLSVLTQGVLHAGNAASVPQVKKWLSLQGLQLGSLNRKELEAIYEDPEGTLGDCDDAARIVEVLKLRQSMTRAMRGKLTRISETVDYDSRIRDWSVYYGAHTGRFSSRRIQLHNLSRGVDMPMDDSDNPETLVQQIVTGPRTLEHVQERIAAAEARIRNKTGKEKKLDVDDVLATLVRPVFRGGPGSVLGIADYNAIEARGVAWLAGETNLLEAFRDPRRDVYCEFAALVFDRFITKKDKVERGIAKICILGMGYGMGHVGLKNYLDREGIDLSAHGLTAEGLVALYRRSYPRIPAMWREIGNQAESARRHGHGICCMGKVGFHADGSSLHLRLPSGRTITYRSCRIEPRVPAYCRARGLPEFEKDTLIYRTTRGFDTTLYGGKLTENIVQAFSRDILCHALLQRPSTVLNVHDEIVDETPTEMAEDMIHDQCRIMSTPPPWAEDFPLRVEGYSCPHYVKQPWSDSCKVDYMGGKQL